MGKQFLEADTGDSNMPDGVKVLGVSGSMRETSHGAKALMIALEAARQYGAQTRLLDLRALDLPVFRPDRSSDLPAVKEAIEAVSWADALIIATPDYHGGMSGAVKNFLDYHWKEFTGKLFGYICSSHEKGLTAMDQLRTAVRQCYGWSLPYGATVHGSQDFNGEGKLINESLHRRLRMLGRDVAVYGAMLVQQYRLDRDAGEKETFARNE